MAKPRKKRQQQEEQQPSQQYDTTFKDWIRKEARNVLPLFLPGAIYEETLDVEIIRPTMRADKVFKGEYQGDDSIFNVEFETGTDNNLLSRLLIYNAVLYRDHGFPVISIIVHPFRTSSFKETSQQYTLVAPSRRHQGVLLTCFFERTLLDGTPAGANGNYCSARESRDKKGVKDV